MRALLQACSREARRRVSGELSKSSAQRRAFAAAPVKADAATPKQREVRKLEAATTQKRTETFEPMLCCFRALGVQFRCRDASVPLQSSMRTRRCPRWRAPKRAEKAGRRRRRELIGPGGEAASPLLLTLSQPLPTKTRNSKHSSSSTPSTASAPTTTRRCPSSSSEE